MCLGQKSLGFIIQQAEGGGVVFSICCSRLHPLLLHDIQTRKTPQGCRSRPYTPHPHPPCKLRPLPPPHTPHHHCADDCTETEGNTPHPRPVEGGSPWGIPPSHPRTPGCGGAGTWEGAEEGGVAGEEPCTPGNSHRNHGNSDHAYRSTTP